MGWSYNLRPADSWLLAGWRNPESKKAREPEIKRASLAAQLYKDIKRLGLKGELRDQLERASLSVVCNLAEGSGKRLDKDRRRFFEIALGSVRESQALIELLDNPNLVAQADMLGAHLWKLIRSFK